MWIVWGIVALLLTYLLVVGLHELGHAITARYFHIHIQEIALGFGKKLLSIQSKTGPEWVLKLWPLGGYVKLLNTRIQPVAPDKWRVSFDKKPIGIRCLVLLAGGFMNLIVAWLCFFLVAGMGYYGTVPRIQNVSPHSLAAQAGIMKGDQLTSVNHTPVTSWQEASSAFILALGGKSIAMTLSPVTPSSLGTEHCVQLDLRHWRPVLSTHSLWEQMGIEPNHRIKHVYPPQSWFQAAQFATRQVVKTIYFFIYSVYLILTGHLPLFLLMGPLSFLDLTIRSFLQSAVTYLYFIAYFSLAVGMVNLLPLPGLDGGNILLALMEKVRGKPISVAAEVLCYRLATIAFCVIFAQLLANDMTRATLHH